MFGEDLGPYRLFPDVGVNVVLLRGTLRRFGCSDCVSLKERYHVPVLLSDRKSLSRPHATVHEPGAQSSETRRSSALVGEALPRWQDWHPQDRLKMASAILGRSGLATTKLLAMR